MSTSPHPRRRSIDGSWTVTDTDVQFHANALNPSIQSGQLDIVVDLRSIESVDVPPDVLTKIIAIHTDDRVTKTRCFGAAKVAGQIRATALSAGSAPQQ